MCKVAYGSRRLLQRATGLVEHKQFKCNESAGGLGICMRYVRRINLSMDAVQRLNYFVNQRYPSLHVEARAMPPSDSCEGTVTGELTDTQATEVDSFISELAAG